MPNCPTSRRIHSDNRSSRNFGQYKNVSKAYVVLSQGDPLQCKNEKRVSFVVLLGTYVSDDIVLANLVSISGEDCS